MAVKIPTTTTLSLLVLCSILLSFSEARDHLIGGKPDAWGIPESDSLNRWAEKSRFQVGDSLVFGGNDTVLHVAKRDYVTCNVSGPIATYNVEVGSVKVELDRSGPWFFISGEERHCVKGQKIIVVVMSEKHRRSYGVSPAASPAESEGPAVAPAPSSGGGRLGVGVLVVLGVMLAVL